MQLEAYTRYLLNTRAANILPATKDATSSSIVPYLRPDISYDSIRAELSPPPIRAIYASILCLGEHFAASLSCLLVADERLRTRKY